MSDSDGIYLATVDPPQRVAARIAEALGIESGIRTDGYPYVARKLDGAEDFVNGLVDRNLEEADLQPDDVSVMDGYPIEIDVYLIVSGGEELLHRESRRLFDDVARALDVPALYVSRWRLVAAHVPGSGTVELPAETSPDVDGSETWAPYAVDRHALTT